uniref:C1q domain-containing protein n=1 Tax=Rhabditophanes sp. KR3021 TaxID=114890 RepID=A0AC35U0E8_9BILA
MITDDFTTRLQVSAPNQGKDCTKTAHLTIYKDANGTTQMIDKEGYTTMPLGNSECVGFETSDAPMSTNRFGSILDGDGITAHGHFMYYQKIVKDANGTTQMIDKEGYTTIPLGNSECVGFETSDAPMSTNRFGSILDGDGTTAHGHFMHYVPSTSEWITGQSQFYTLAKDCFLEIYADNSQFNAINSIYIDGHILGTFLYGRTDITFFENYVQFVVQVTKYGLHTITSPGKYIAYVICKNVNGFNNAAGYLIGFNHRPSN